MVWVFKERGFEEELLMGNVLRLHFIKNKRAFYILTKNVFRLTKSKHNQYRKCLRKMCCIETNGAWTWLKRLLGVIYNLYIESTAFYTKFSTS